MSTNVAFFNAFPYINRVTPTVSGANKRKEIRRKIKKIITTTKRKKRKVSEQCTKASMV